METLVFYVVMGVTYLFLLVVRWRLNLTYSKYSRVPNLSLENARDASVAAMAVSAHEAAHALQDADNYAPLELRTSILPLVQAGARLGIPLAMFGSLFDSRPMFLLGTLAYVGSIVFYFITLPVDPVEDRHRNVGDNPVGREPPHGPHKGAAAHDALSTVAATRA
jgi:Zn-dependent membrane protease YugP